MACLNTYSKFGIKPENPSKVKSYNEASYWPDDHVVSRRFYAPKFP